MGQDVGHFPLTDGETVLGKQGLHHALLVVPFVRLHPEGVDSWPFAGVQRPALQGGVINGQGHLAPQGVHLAHQLAFAGAADGGVAGHQGDALHVEGHQQGLLPQAGSGQGGFAAGMPGADHHQIVVCMLTHFLRFLLS